MAWELRQLGAVPLSNSHSLEWEEKGESGKRSHGYANTVFCELAPSLRARRFEASGSQPLQEKVEGTTLY